MKQTQEEREKIRKLNAESKAKREKKKKAAAARKAKKDEESKQVVKPIGGRPPEDYQLLREVIACKRPVKDLENTEAFNFLDEFHDELAGNSGSKRDIVYLFQPYEYDYMENGYFSGRPMTFPQVLKFLEKIWGAWKQKYGRKKSVKILHDDETMREIWNDDFTYSYLIGGADIDLYEDSIITDYTNPAGGDKRFDAERKFIVNPKTGENINLAGKQKGIIGRKKTAAEIRKEIRDS